jgi:hypothetical protein
MAHIESGRLTCVLLASVTVRNIALLWLWFAVG